MAKKAAIILCSLALLLASCANELVTNRIPSAPVAINLRDPGLWATYGVGGVGMYRTFIKESRLPSGFPYVEASYTGYGGVLLFGAYPVYVDDGPTMPCVPVAYDLSCPVEAKANIRITVDPDNLQGYCSDCGSRYELGGGGYPLSGPAKELNYGLKAYRCIGSWPSGFVITN